MEPYDEEAYKPNLDCARLPSLGSRRCYGGQHRLDQRLDLLNVSRPQIAQLVMPFLCGQLIELLGVQGIYRIPLRVERQAVLKGELFHLPEGITAIEVAAHIILGTGNLRIVEVLLIGSLGQHLENVIDSGVPDQEAAIGLLDLIQITGFRGGLALLNLVHLRRRWGRNLWQAHWPRKSRSYRSCNRHWFSRKLLGRRRPPGHARRRGIDPGGAQFQRGAFFTFFWESWNRHLLPVSEGTGQQQYREQRFVHFHGVVLLGGIGALRKRRRRIQLDTEGFDLATITRRDTPDLDLT